jgi:hypothetical protein
MIRKGFRQKLKKWGERGVGGKEKGWLIRKGKREMATAESIRFRSS